MVLNKRDKERLVVQLHQEGKTIREIASAAHLSFSDIGSIIRKIDGKDDGNSEIKDLSQAIYLFSIGKTPLEVKIELDISTTEVHDL